MRLILAALLAACPARLHAEAFGELTGLGGALPESVAPARGALVKKGPSRRTCPSDWQKKRTGDCWTPSGFFDGEEEVLAYVHPGGWLVDPRCFKDKRFSEAEVIEALSIAERKIDPALSSESGGCLGTYNPEWGGRLKDQVWSNRMMIQCPQNYDRNARTCADAGRRDAWLTEAGGSHRLKKDYIRMISLRNVAGCMVKDSSGLAGTLFHETLHGADADNVDTETHNKGWEREQYKFVFDRVYGAEATCFFGAKANVVQCRRTVEYQNDAPRFELCGGFEKNFTDLPPGFLKH